METQQLRYFVAVIERGNFTAAASACRISQPSLSVQIANLEEELGGRLFERSRKGALLTDRGRRLYPFVRDALRFLEQGKEALAQMDGLNVGSVRLGCLPITGAHLLPAVLKAFRRRWPGLHVELKEASSPDLSESLADGSVDLAILDEAGLEGPLEHEALFSEPLDLAVPPRHPLTKKSKVRLADLGDEPFILMKPGHGFRNIVERAFQNAGIAPKIVMESGEIETVQSMVGAGLGLALVPRMVRKPGGPVYLALASPVPRRTLSLAWRKGAALPPAALRFKEHALKSLQRGRSKGYA